MSAVKFANSRITLEKYPQSQLKSKQMNIEKHIGIVKWFHDKAKEADYGFIEHPAMPDHYFNAASLDKDQDINKIKEREVVVFHSKISKRKADSFEAINVKLISDEKDLIYLFTQLVDIISVKDYDERYEIIRIAVDAKCRNLLASNPGESIFWKLQELFLNHVRNNLILENSDNKNVVTLLIKLCKEYFPDILDETISILETQGDSFILHQLWMDDYIDSCQTDYLAVVLLNDRPQRVKQILEKCNEVEKVLILENMLQRIPLIENMGDWSNISEVTDFCKVFLPEFDDFLREKLQNLVNKLISSIQDSELLHALWMEGYSDSCQIDYLATVLLDEDSYQLRKVFLKCSEAERQLILEKMLEHLAVISDFDDLSRILVILQTCSEYLNESLDHLRALVHVMVEKSLPAIQDQKLLHQLWLEGLSKQCQVSYIADFILDAGSEVKNEIFNLCSNEDKRNIFYKILFDIKEGYHKPNADYIKRLVTLFSEQLPDQKDHVISEIYQICPTHIKLQLWLEGFHDILNFDEYKMFTITLSAEDQKKFVKKVLKHIHEGKVNITFDDLISISVVDYETSKKIALGTTIRVDYSTSIMLNTIKELSRQISLKTKRELREAEFRIYDIIIDQIKDPSDILEINGYFDMCEGRCSAKVEEIKDEDGKVINAQVTYIRNTNSVPKYHLFCDGRKALIKGTDQPVIDEKELEYWFCGHQKCYKPSRRLHTSKEWEMYNLVDFMHVLKVPYREVDYEIYLGVINKANRFLKHLKCRECQNIMKPVGRANYAIHGVNEFHCQNLLCSAIGKRVYLTHCLNGYCEHIIDSRDSVKCRPGGYDQAKSGWYICNNCLGCCSNSAIERRIKRLSDLNQVYGGSPIGHKEQNIICCNKCGHGMKKQEKNIVKYKEALDWFVKNKDNTNYIEKYGSRKGKYWFRYKNANRTKEDFQKDLENLANLGFSVPNIGEFRRVQLVSEPLNYGHGIQKLVCEHCANIIDFSMDVERKIAFEKYHTIIEKKE